MRGQSLRLLDVGRGPEQIPPSNEDSKRKLDTNRVLLREGGLLVHIIFVRLAYMFVKYAFVLRQKWSLCIGNI